MHKNKSLVFQLLSTAVAIICLLSMYVFPDFVKKSVLESIQMCGKTLIPSLYPFIICTRICAELIMRTISKTKPCRLPVINTSPAGLLILILGLISGFPNGAYLAGTAYKSGSISKDEATRIMTFSNCISPSFCILVFGSEVMKSKLLGVIVFLAIICSNLLLFLLSREQKGIKTNEPQREICDYKATPISAIISESLSIMLVICAYVTVFYCFSALIGKVLTVLFYVPTLVTGYISSLLEISGGALKLSSLPFFKRLFMGSLLLSLGGVSAIMQVQNVCLKYGLRFKGFIAKRLLCCVMTPVFTVIFCCIIGNTAVTKNTFTGIINSIGMYILISILLAVILKGVYVVIIRILKAKDYKKSKLNF